MTTLEIRAVWDDEANVWVSEPLIDAYEPDYTDKALCVIVFICENQRFRP